jgi:hypothetical protein
VNSTGADRDREQRRARHAQRVSTLRAQRKQAGRAARTGVAGQLANPFAAVQPDREMTIAEEAFPR